MDKKKLFQKQLLQRQIDENKTTLLQLEIKYDTLKLENNHIISNNIIKDIRNDIISNGIVNINLILEQIKNLENTKKIKKEKINDTQHCISTLEEKLKYHPDTIKDKIENEDNIYNDEIDRINKDKIDTECNNIEILNNANIDKDNLLKEIDLMKNSIKEHTIIISNMQIECHSSRKNVLDSLKDKKQLKLTVNNNINNLNISSNVFIQNINNLETDINHLLEFKKILVDDEYNINSNINSNTIAKLTEYYSQYNIDTNLSLNDKIDLIDNLIINNKQAILLQEKQKQKTETIHKIQITESLNIYNTTNNYKVLTYKDKFKIEKEKKNQIQTILDDKLNLYNNYKTLIIDKINDIYEKKLKELEKDTINALDRLNITKIRINLENENNKQNLKEKLANNYLELENLYRDISNSTNEIKLLSIEIEKANSINTELSTLENRMKKHKDIISESEKDLLSLN
jgi:hypothetical protein